MNTLFDEHVAKLLYTFTSDNLHYFIYEKGTEILFDYLRSRKNLDILSKLQILSDIAQGLEAMHSTNIAHMDLKLENIMKIDERFKIIDLESSINFNLPVSNDVNVKSTLSIMPPELYTFDKDKFSIKIDIWS